MKVLSLENVECISKADFILVEEWACYVALLAENHTVHFLTLKFWALWHFQFFLVARQ